jgi:hypothetical protein
MATNVSTLLENVAGSYSRWPLGTIKFMMINPSAPNVNDRLTRTQEGKEYRFIVTLFAETINRSDGFFSDYFAYLDANAGVQVGPQNITPYYANFLDNRLPYGSIYGLPVMRVK